MAVEFLDPYIILNQKYIFPPFECHTRVIRHTATVCILIFGVGQNAVSARINECDGLVVGRVIHIIPYNTHICLATTCF